MKNEVIYVQYSFTWTYISKQIIYESSLPPSGHKGPSKKIKKTWYTTKLHSFKIYHFPKGNVLSGHICAVHRGLSLLKCLTTGTGYGVKYSVYIINGFKSV